MKIFLGYGLALLLGLGLGIGVMTATMSWAPPMITVEVQNLTGQPVSNIIITHEKGKVSIDQLEPGAVQTLPVFVQGESSYHIQATLAGGQIVRGQGGYVEQGYRIREKITSTDIKHEQQSMY